MPVPIMMRPSSAWSRAEHWSSSKSIGFAGDVVIKASGTRRLDVKLQLTQSNRHMSPEGLMEERVP